MLGRHAEPILPLLIARQAVTRGAVVWCDPVGQLYLPTMVAMGLKLDRLILLQPRNSQDHLWAMSECLRCKGVAAMVASVQQLSMLDARRLQLAAEGGGGVGILLRPATALHQPYAAATRWMFQPQPGERTVRRWKAQLIHGHGGRVGESVILEVKRRAEKAQCILSVADVLEAGEGLLIAAHPPRKANETFDRQLAVLKEGFGDRLSLVAACVFENDHVSWLAQLDAVRRRTGVPLLASNLPHYHIPERHRLQDVLTCIRHGCTIHSAGYKLFPNGERYRSCSTDR